jgi:hypothetical protein
MHYLSIGEMQALIMRQKSYQLHVYWTPI